MSSDNDKIFKKVADVTVKETLGDKIFAILSDPDYSTGMTTRDLRQVLSEYHGYEDGKSLDSAVHKWCKSQLATRKGVYRELAFWKIEDAA